MDSNTSCSGTADGTIDLTTTGGSGGFTYTWTGPGSFTAGTADLGGLLAGSYAVTITDLNGCTLALPVEVTGPQALAPMLDAFTFPGGTNISCAGTE